VGERVLPEHPCEKCKRHFAVNNQENTMENDYTAPDPYAAPIATLRAAERRTAEERFAEQYKAERTRELDAERAEIDAHIAATPAPRLTTAELAAYVAPDPYAAGIKALQLKEARR
jgi:hypothetical protein